MGQKCSFEYYVLLKKIIHKQYYLNFLNSQNCCHIRNIFYHENFSFLIKKFFAFEFNIMLYVLLCFLHYQGALQMLYRITRFYANIKRKPESIYLFSNQLYCKTHPFQSCHVQVFPYSTVTCLHHFNMNAENNPLSIQHNLIQSLETPCTLVLQAIMSIVHVCVHRQYQ